MPFNCFYRIIFFVLIFVLFSTQSYSDDTAKEQGGVGTLKKAMERAKEYEKKILEPDYLPDYKKNAAEKIEEISELIKSAGIQKRIEQYKNILADKFVDPDYLSGQTDEKNFPTFLLNSSEKIYIFISSSIPITTLRNYARDIHVLSDPNISLVMRGFVDGMKYIAPTSDFVKSITFNDPDCISAEGEKCKAFNTSIVIDPLLFRKYNIKSVPAFVYARGLKLIDFSENEGENKKSGSAYSLYGDVSLGYALEQIFEKTNFKKLNKIIRKIRGDFY